MYNFILFIFFILKIVLTSPICKEGLNNCSLCNPLTKLCTKCSLEIYSPNEEGGCSPIYKCQLGKNYCLICDELGKNCLECQKGLYPDENGGCSFTDNCEISYKGHCLKCKSDFILTGEICKSLDLDDFAFCSKINDETGQCEECQKGYYLNNGDKKCSSIENCDESTFGKCISCERGFYLDIKEDKCIRYNSNNFPLLFCKESLDRKKCDKCVEDYFFDEEGNCININYCLEKKEYLCNKCIDGYYFTKYRDTCVNDPNCSLGDGIHGLCRLCNDNYYLDLNDMKCKLNNENDNFKFCEKVENNKCISCKFPNYLSEDGKCTTTKNCSEVENGVCLSCVDGYYLGNDNRCIDVEHCIYSETYYECKECEDGFYYNRTNKTCLKYIKGYENCRVTSYKGDYCSFCKSNFYANQSDHLCYSNKENDNFYKCILTDLSGALCAKCENGYYIGIKDNKCTPNIENCEILNEKGDECLQCNRNYCYNKKLKKCEISNEIISEEKKFLYRCIMTSEEGTECEICDNSYTLKDGLCVYDRFCLEKDSNGDCLKCYKRSGDYSYCINKYFGCMVHFDVNCHECNNINDFDECTKCEDGYELNEKGKCALVF